MKYLLLLFVTFTGVFTIPLKQESNDVETIDYSENEIMKNTPNFITKCTISSKDIMSFLSCTAEETLTIIRKVSHIRSLEFIPGLSFISHDDPKTSLRKFNSVDLPQDPYERFFKLMDMVFDASNEFVSGRTIKFEFPEMPIEKYQEEGRGKKKKIKQLFDLIMKVLLVKLMSYGPAIAIIGGIAIKALLAAKLAFIIATVLGLQSLSGSSGGGLSSLFSKGNSGGSNSHSGGWESQPQHSSGWERSFLYSGEKTEKLQTPQQLAYSQQIPH